MVLRCLTRETRTSILASSRVKLSQLQLGRRFDHASYASSPKAPAVAFAFDIDGVLMQGSHVLPQAKRVLRMLNGENIWKRQFPYIVMTNGGGKPELERCRELSEKLETNIDLSMFMQSHTIIGSRVLPYLERYADKPIMVVGGFNDTCRKIAESYGFQNVLTPLDALAWNEDLWPYYSLTDTEARSVRNNFDFSSTPIHAVFVFHDSRSWGLDVQICLDIVRYGSQARSAFNPTNGPPNFGEEKPVELVFCNPDLLWRGGYHKPRLGQGGFREAFQGVYQALEEKTYLAKQLGKPSTETYAHAADMIKRRIAGLISQDQQWVDGTYSDAHYIYMIGDNPESDIAGANAIGWNSVLVHTGVYSPESGPPTHTPTFQARDVEEAVALAMERESGR